jgi:hypothetical protein
MGDEALGPSPIPIPISGASYFADVAPATGCLISQ